MKLSFCLVLLFFHFPLTTILVDAFPSSFSSAAAPRFDEFVENIVGKWNYHDKSYAVEEVMRSCGGAVQGVRESPLWTDQPDYLNRANDGFLFYNCGSYSFGPTKVTKNDKSSFFVTNFKLCDTPSRVIVGFQVFHDEIFEDEPFSFVLSKPFHNNSLLQLQYTHSSEYEDREFSFCREMRCAMPSVSQHWNLQRAKWEKKIKEEAGLSSMDCAEYKFFAEVKRESNTLRVTTSVISSSYSLTSTRIYGNNGELIEVTLKEVHYKLD